MISKKESFTALKIYLAVWAIVIGLLLYVVFRDNLSASQVLTQSLTSSSFLIALHVLFLLLYLLFLVGRYFLRVYKKKGTTVMLKRLALRFFLPILIAFITISSIVNYNKSEDYSYTWDSSIENNTGCSQEYYQSDGKHRGMTVFGWRRNSKETIETLVKNNVEWVAIVPFFYQEDEAASVMRTPQNAERSSRRDSAFIASIANLHDKGINVMLKPHLWLGDGWRSNIKLNTDAEWDSWFDDYKKGILHYAEMAELTGVQLLCIGTELKSSLESKQDRWIALVKDIKNVYKGKLTYAANWDGEYNLVEFWEEMDYIGIQGYFPLTESKNPDLEKIKEGWNQHVITLEKLSKSVNRPVLFTEIGYKNEASSTIRPWEWGSFFSILFRKKSNKTQQLAFEALYGSLWDKDWFAGTYVWQWNNSSNEIDFTPQGKPAQNTIAEWYGLKGYSSTIIY